MRKPLIHVSLKIAGKKGAIYIIIATEVVTLSPGVLE